MSFCLGVSFPPFIKFPPLSTDFPYSTFFFLFSFPSSFAPLEYDFLLLIQLSQKFTLSFVTSLFFPLSPRFNVPSPFLFFEGPFDWTSFAVLPFQVRLGHVFFPKINSTSLSQAVFPPATSPFFLHWTGSLLPYRLSLPGALAIFLLPRPQEYFVLCVLYTSFLRPTSPLLSFRPGPFFLFPPFVPVASGLAVYADVFPPLFQILSRVSPILPALPVES